MADTESVMSRTSIFRAIRGRDAVVEAEPVEVAKPVYKPTYTEKLRLIGMHFDAHELSAVKVMEVPGGFLARAECPTGGDELLEFPDTLFPQLFEEAVTQRGAEDDTDSLRLKSELIPTSYADVMRAIGEELDSCLARSVVISEGPDAIYLAGMRLENNSLRSTVTPFSQLLYPDDIDYLLDVSYRRRATL